MRAWVVALAALTAAGCGDDEEANPPAQAAKPAQAAAAASGSKTLLAEKVHIEDRVACPIPDRPTDPRNGKCDPKAPSCSDHTYCLQLAQGSYCEPCPERDGIRHSFKERDFAVEQNRDPFQSFLLPQLSISRANDAVPLDPTKKCLREDQMVAGSYSYSDLKLVGIVAQGTQRKVLMMGGPLGYIIKRGDCVGKEKAVVKDIGTGYITFQVEPDQLTATTRSPEEYSVQLNPKQLMINEPELPQLAPRTSITPVVPPPATLPQRSGPAPAPAGQVAPPVVAPGQASAAPAAPAVPATATVIVPVVPGQVQVPVEAPIAPKKSYVPAESSKR